MTLPSFLIIGAMKAGSTSLFRWLGSHPGIALPDDKEPAFFSDDRRWNRGLEHYEAGFPVGTERLTGEASVVYTDPATSALAARRASTVLPALRLIFLARDPAERLRSHYRHQVQRGRERQQLLQALTRPDQPYVRCSLYREALAPWLTHFPRQQLCTIRFERLVQEEPDEWQTVLRFLNLSPMPRPAEAHNVTGDKQVFSPVMRRLFEAGAARYEHLLPRPLKSAIKPLLFRRGPQYDRLLKSGRDPLPEAISKVLSADFGAFEREIGWGVGPNAS